MKRKIWPFVLLLLLAAKCPSGSLSGVGGRPISDRLRLESGGEEISRLASNPNDCSSVDPRAQNLFIQWGRDRNQEGRPISASMAARVLGLQTRESGGGRGVGPDNITPHQAERSGNRAGYNGVTEANVANVEGYIRKNRRYITHQTNAGGGQTSPDIFANYPAAIRLLKTAASGPNVDIVFARCLTDIAYASSDHGLAKHHLSQLMSQRGEIDSWISTIKKYSSRKNQTAARSACSSDPACYHASSQIIRWFAYCPRLGMETTEHVLLANSRYFSPKTRRAAPKCEQVLYAEINKYNPNVQLVGEPQSHDEKFGGSLL